MTDNKDLSQPSEQEIVATETTTPKEWVDALILGYKMWPNTSIPKLLLLEQVLITPNIDFKTFAETKLTPEQVEQIRLAASLPERESKYNEYSWERDKEYVFSHIVKFSMRNTISGRWGLNRASQERLDGKGNGSVEVLESFFNKIVKNDEQRSFLLERLDLIRSIAIKSETGRMYSKRHLEESATDFFGRGESVEDFEDHIQRALNDRFGKTRTGLPEQWWLEN